jgi:hypothetical protein
MSKHIGLLSKQLLSCETDQQYLVFRPVTETNLDEIDGARNTIGKSARLTYYADADLLVIKLMPSPEHEMSHLELGKWITLKLAVIRVPATSYRLVGAGRYYNGTRTSSKERDSAFLPVPVRRLGWPTLIIEAGLSESLRRLRIDAKWWLENSGGAVNIVVIISLNRPRTKATIEKWEIAQGGVGRPITRAIINNSMVPVSTHVITVNRNRNTGATTVIGAPLVLEFAKIFLRPAVLPETNINFTAQDLLDCLEDVWG